MDTQIEKKNEVAAAEKSGLKKWKYFLLGIATLVALAVIFGIAYTVYAVRNVSQSPYVLKVAEVLNLPVVRVNGASIPYHLYIEDVNTLKAFYQKAPEGAIPEFSEAELSEQVLSRLIVNTLIKDFAREFKVSVNEEDISKVKDTILADYDSLEQVEAMLKTEYNWDLETYIEKIIKPFVLEQKVSEFFTLGEGELNWEKYPTNTQVNARHILFQVENEEDNSSVQKQAQTVLERIVAGEDFAELAAEFGSDSTRDNGGDLGWFGQGVMVPEFEEAVFALEPGAVADAPVKTQFGYHLVKLEGKREVRSFTDLLNDRLYESNVEILINVSDPLAQFRAGMEQAKQLEELSALELE